MRPDVLVGARRQTEEDRRIDKLRNELPLRAFQVTAVIIRRCYLRWFWSIALRRKMVLLLCRDSENPRQNTNIWTCLVGKDVIQSEG